jgi:hypothetical protein
MKTKFLPLTMLAIFLALISITFLPSCDGTNNKDSNSDTTSSGKIVDPASSDAKKVDTIRPKETLDRTGAINSTNGVKSQIASKNKMTRKR